ncbi:DUF5134 domain-containing protein [Streptomyces clavuligerus]|uniref:Integral membrane protein n=1 Tax=Streptomyces clavuligerus TaxID=1901 RepID=B5H2P3_STRCL|nr:DUF5134 domain-containing protein [Streptomyces clavuligerus]ANW21468.1 DUF5134 domain-containing protein [Streptomyces clavuligerus]AXU16099.1 DUF5134 domain-containing protein [Streptomyces clavuligerus]EDY52839.1 integral membrane protein [Streptomyces clavuligerus]EFG05377.1 integral membrane protein [Streptomyces clavuligerus]MBY6306238.1 DUF5134 domain-containing protein [Streptomyces clavuligerus]
MHGPVVAGWLIAALSAATGGYCLARVRRCPGPGRRAGVEDGLMGLGMAAMALPAVMDAAGPVYAVVFGGAAVHALWSARHGPAGHLHHLVGSLAMVYMAVAMTPASASGHAVHTGPPSAAGIPLVTGALLVYYAVYALRAGARLVPSVPVVPAAGSGAWGDGTEPGAELTSACRLTMALGMLAMLLAL